MSRYDLHICGAGSLLLGPRNVRRGCTGVASVCISAAPVLPCSCRGKCLYTHSSLLLCSEYCRYFVIILLQPCIFLIYITVIYVSELQLASVEAGKFNTTAANRVLEQALASDFSIRSAPRFRLVKAIIRAQQVR